MILMNFSTQLYFMILEGSKVDNESFDIVHNERGNALIFCDMTQNLWLNWEFYFYKSLSCHCWNFQKNLSFSSASRSLSICHEGYRPFWFITIVWTKLLIDFRLQKERKTKRSQPIITKCLTTEEWMLIWNCNSKPVEKDKQWVLERGTYEPLGRP